jgi:ribosomal protein L37E
VNFADPLEPAPEPSRDLPPPARDAGGETVAGSPGRRFEPKEGACELCGRPQLDRHCKVVCPSCGFVRDCSDP